MEYLLGLTTQPGGRPAGVSLEYDCSWRELAVPYALKLQPSMTEAQQMQLHDALQLSTLCAKPFVPVPSAPAPPLEELVPGVAGRVISDCHFAVQLKHFIPVFLSYSVAVFLN
jgi:hypothetical protein